MRVEKKARKEKTKFFTTTITGGKYKGKKIKIPDIFTTRSSKSILKESLFNTLQFEVVDKNFVEVFAGSGSIGLEALSRGAGEAYFIEYNRTAYEALRENSNTIDSHHSHLFFGNSFEKFDDVYRLVKASRIKTYFYFDPPFSTREGMDDVYEQTLALLRSIEAEVCEVAIVEHMTNLDLPEKIGVLKQVKRKRFGRSSLSYYKP